MRNLKTALIPLIAVWVMHSPARAEEINKEFHEAFEAAPGIRLELRHGDGDLRIEPWDQDSIDIHVIYRATATSIGTSGQRNLQVTFEQRGDTVLVEGRETGGSGIGIRKYRVHEYLYTVRAPAWVELEFRGDDGDAEISDWTGTIQGTLEDGDLVLRRISGSKTGLKLEDGDLRIEGVKGELEIESEDGDIWIVDCSSTAAKLRIEDGDTHIQECAGSFDIASEDGDVRLESVSASTLKIISGDGDAHIDLRNSPDLAMQVDTHDGGVVVVLAPEQSSEFAIDTNDGGIQIEAAAVEFSIQNEHRASGHIGDGGGSMRITTVDGGVKIRQRTD